MLPIAEYIKMVAPVDVLMTARSISVNTIAGGCAIPLILLKVHQPHTIICTKPGAQRFEISLYDMKLLMYPASCGSLEGNDSSFYVIQMCSTAPRVT